MTSKQLLSWAGMAVTIGGALASLGHLVPGEIGVVIVALGAGATALGDSIINAKP